SLCSSLPILLTLVFLTPSPPPALPLFFSFTAPATTEIYTLSLHDALPICESDIGQAPFLGQLQRVLERPGMREPTVLESGEEDRSEEHTSELQSRFDLVCRLLLEKKKKKNKRQAHIVKMKHHTEEETNKAR